MRILIITPYLPWPLNSGGNAAQFSTLQCLADDHEFTLLCPISSGQMADADQLAVRLPQLRLRAIAPAEPATAPPSLLRRFARSALHRLRRSFSPQAGSTSTRQVQSPLPYYPFHHLSGEFIACLHEELARPPDLVQCEFAEMMPLGSILPATVARVFVHIQVHHVYVRRHLEVHGASPYARYLAGWMRVQEQAYLREFDAIITLSEDDRQSLAGMVDLSNVHASPYPLPADVGVVSEIPPVSGRLFVFLGSEPHEPNQDALRWLLDDIWPQISARVPNAQLSVIGQWSDSWRSRPGADRVAFTGFVEDLGSAIRGSIMLVPVRIGSGLRTKILAAFAQGAPVVSTTVGAEGLLARDGHDCLLRDNAADFAAAAVQLAESTTLCAGLASAALALVRTHYSPEAVRQRRNAIYATLLARRKTNPARP